MTNLKVQTNFQTGRTWLILD